MSPYNVFLSLPLWNAPSHLLNHLVKLMSSENFPKVITINSKNLNLKVKCHQMKISKNQLTSRVELQQKSKLRHRQFQVVDLAMWKAHPYQLENKLSPKWTDSFRMVEVLINGSYKLETLEGGAIARTWNGANIKFYFSWYIFVNVLWTIRIIKGTLFFPYEGFLMRSPNEELFLKDELPELFFGTR